MGVRSRIGRAAVAARLRRDFVAFAVLVAGCALAPSLSAADGRGTAMQHHATVLNGTVVGSAFAIADGIAVTNAHVVRGLRPGAPLDIVATAGPRRRAVARLVATSQRMDVAVLAVPRGFLRAVSGDDAPMVSGLPVIAAGVDASGRRRDLPRMQLSGRVLATDRNLPDYGPGLIVQVPGVRPGFSGGPMLDGRGRLVGMVAAIRPGRSAPAAASGFAPRHRPAAVAQEAYVLDAGALRAEVHRLLARTGH